MGTKGFRILSRGLTDWLRARIVAAETMPPAFDEHSMVVLFPELPQLFPNAEPSTVRGALSRLGHAGVIERIGGKGSPFRMPPAERDAEASGIEAIDEALAALAKAERVLRAQRDAVAKLAELRRLVAA